MKNISFVKLLFCNIAASIFTYLSFVFVLLEFDFRLWEIGQRGGFIIVLIASMIFLTGVYFVEKITS